MLRFFYKRKLLSISIGAIFLAALSIFVAGRLIERISPNDTMRAAWIGFSGSILGSILTLAVAAIALWPSYQQLQQQIQVNRRSAAVTASEVLRARWQVCRAEWDNLLLDAPLWTNRSALALDPEDSDFVTWSRRHLDRAVAIRDVMLPNVIAIEEKIRTADLSLDLPEVLRGEYQNALRQLRCMLEAVINGWLVEESGEAGPNMTPDEWRGHVVRTADFIDKHYGPSKSVYNMSLVNTQSMLRHAVRKADRVAMGEEATAMFDWVRSNSGVVEK